MTIKKNLVLMIPQLRHGGAERVVSRLSYLLRDYFNVFVVVFDKSTITYDTECEIISLEATPTPNLNIIKRTFNLIKRVYAYKKFKSIKNIDITYSFGDSANLINVLSGKSDYKIISIRGFKRVRDGKGLINKFIIKPISKVISIKADAIISVSEVISQKISDLYNIDKKKIVTINNGYDLENIRKLSEESLSSEEYNLFYSFKVFITAGTFRSEKGYWHLLKSFSLVRKTDDNVKLFILGEDYKGNKNKVIKLAKSLGIEQDVIFGGYQKNPYKYFSNSACYILSSTSEGFPNAMVEAMSCGLPVISSDCKSGPREIISPNSSIEAISRGIELGEFGILVEPMNPDEIWNPEIIESCDKELAQAMITFLNDTNLRNRYVQLSRLRSEDFSYESWLSKHLNVLGS